MTKHLSAYVNDVFPGHGVRSIRESANVLGPSTVVARFADVDAASRAAVTVVDAPDGNVDVVAILRPPKDPAVGSGDSIASDFYREVAARLDSDTRALVLAVLDDTGHGNFAVEKVRAAIDADPRVGGRLALWARRLMGEALSQAQRVVAERDALSTMLVGGVADGFDLAEVGRMFSRITEAHTKRMAALGLAA